MDHSPCSCRWLIATLLWVGCTESPDNSHTYHEPAQLPERHQPVEVPIALETVSPTREPVIRPTSLQTVETPLAPPSVPHPGQPQASRGPDTAPLIELTYSVPPPPPQAVALEIARKEPAFAVREMKLLIPDKQFKSERDALRVTFDDVDLLKVLNVEPVPDDVEKALPDWLRGLSGQRVRIRGWMFPPPYEEGLEQFAFVRDNEICCFGREAKVYDKFGVSLKPGTTARYIEGRPFDVIGTMHVKSRFLGEKLMYLYTLSDAEIIDR
ncbi:MAG: hypothetical protein DWH91_10890 [Planctomycetota bacterium]|nr:MAG: hypothetical protein DWH91_10890 [Planctomycetota bacterium]